MPHFFSCVESSTQKKHGTAVFDLPISYFRDDAFALFYTADLNKVKSWMPSDRLHPIRLPGGRTLIAIAAFNYIDTSIGSYGEIGIVAPAVYGNAPPPMLLPALLESRYPGFGALVLHLPVTKTVARDAGRGEWGYTKFVADMHFRITPEHLSCKMSDQGNEILSLRVPRGGIPMKDRKPLVTYSVLHNNLIKTVIPQTGTYRLTLSPADAGLTLGNHPAADTLRDAALAPKPLMSRYYLERYAVLPAGSIIEKDVRPLYGHIGDDREGIHEISYMD